MDRNRVPVAKQYGGLSLAQLRFSERAEGRIARPVSGRKTERAKSTLDCLGPPIRKRDKMAGLDDDSLILTLPLIVEVVF